MKRLKILFFTFLSINYLFANTNNEDISNNIIKSASEGRDVINEQKLEKIQGKSEKENRLRKAVILNYINYYENPKNNPRAKEFIGTKLENAFVQNIIKDENATDNNQSQNTELVNVKGFCFIKEEINAGVQPASMRVECNTNVGFITLFANLVNVNEKLSLMADPKYIEKNKVRFNVKSAIVLNEEKTSYNLATYVNDRKVEEIGWNSLSYSSDEIKNATNEYLQALQESKKKQDVQYITTSDGAGNSYMSPIQSTNTEKPNASDYFATAGVNIIADIVKSTAEVFKKDLPYLYQIVPKTKIWIDLEVEKKGVYVK